MRIQKIVVPVDYNLSKSSFIVICSSTSKPCRDRVICKTHGNTISVKKLFCFFTLNIKNEHIFINLSEDRLLTNMIGYLCIDLNSILCNSVTVEWFSFRCVCSKNPFLINIKFHVSNHTHIYPFHAALNHRSLRNLNDYESFITMQNKDEFDYYY